MSYRTQTILKSVATGFLLCIILIVITIITFIKITKISVKNIDDIMTFVLKKSDDIKYIPEENTTTIFITKLEIPKGGLINDDLYYSIQIDDKYLDENYIINLESLNGYFSKSYIPSNTILSHSHISDVENIEIIGKLVEYQEIKSSINCNINDTIDIRISFPSGLDYNIITKKKILDLKKTDSQVNQSIIMSLNEEEILRMSSAITDTELYEDTFLYAVLYKNSALQDKPVSNYPVNIYVETLIFNISENINILEILNKTKNKVKELNINRSFLESSIKQYLNNKNPISNTENPNSEKTDDYSYSVIK